MQTGIISSGFSVSRIPKELMEEFNMNPSYEKHETKRDHEQDALYKLMASGLSTREAKRKLKRINQKKRQKMLRK